MLHHCALKIPEDDIPGGTWSVAYAPAVLENKGWMVLFGVPGVSNFVWALWAQSASLPRGTSTHAHAQSPDHAEREMIQFFANLVVEGSLMPEKEMKVGDNRHEKFHGIVQQALWMDRESAFLGAEWRTGEFGGRF